MRPKLLDRLKAHGFRVFEDGLFNLNIIGVRTKGEPNKFDDRICLVYKDKHGWVTREWPATTDPGTYWLENPSKFQGTAVMASPQQCRSAYKIDLHRGQYEALCQRLSKVKVWRDGDKNDTVDWDQFDDSVEGWYGINIHRAGANSMQVDKWSAGCQVFQRASDFDSFMELVKASEALYGNKFTYTLIDEETP
tara:strand:- start:936 stop:1514 length:579 start_codon:yes stop_codon:yes gene_type:complete